MWPWKKILPVPCRSISSCGPALCCTRIFRAKSLDAVKQDARPKYIVMREFMYNKMKEKMGGEDWELLENKSGICIYRSR